VLKHGGQCCCCAPTSPRGTGAGAAEVARLAGDGPGRLRADGGGRWFGAGPGLTLVLWDRSARPRRASWPCFFGLAAVLVPAGAADTKAPALPPRRWRARGRRCAKTEKRWLARSPSRASLPTRQPPMSVAPPRTGSPTCRRRAHAQRLATQLAIFEAREQLAPLRRRRRLVDGRPGAFAGRRCRRHDRPAGQVPVSGIRGSVPRWERSPGGWFAGGRSRCWLPRWPALRHGGCSARRTGRAPPSRRRNE